jgi:hypothetical protein
MSIHIPQVSVDQKGNLIPNPGENIISMYKPVMHDKHEGELYVTDSRIAWIGTKAKGSLLGKVAKAAVMVAALSAAGSMASQRRGGMGMGMGLGMGMGMGGLGMTHMVSRNRQGQPQSASLPYQVINDIQVGSDQKTLIVGTQAGSLQFGFQRAGDADAVSTVVRERRLETQRRFGQSQQSANYRHATPPQYVAPPTGNYHYCPHCGTPIEPDSTYCHNCGGRVQ